MSLLEARRIFETYLAAQNLKHSRPRLQVMESFIAAGEHLTAEELHRRVKRKFPHIGVATVYRTLKLMHAGGLCGELKLQDGTTRYEALCGRDHHDHLICTRCGRLEEVVDPDIEALQGKLFKRHGYRPQWHRLELYGLCGSCLKKSAAPGTQEG
ncbi:MAG: transcriptional repressor [Candidatus Firestonebacteria bacterium]|nr:transcriptional repressor [Candidatus Firestonebacteria bacterium]